MTNELYGVYLAALTVGMLTPGPAMLQALTLGLRHGPRPVIAVALGNVCVAVLQVALVLSGLNLLATRPDLLQLAALAGAGYLAFLGWKIWRASAPHAGMEQTNTPRPALAALFAQGALVAATNPKAWGSLAALLPRFAGEEAVTGTTLALLAGPIAILAFGGMLAYAVCGAWLSRLLASPRAMRRFFRGVAAILWLCAGCFAAWPQ